MNTTSKAGSLVIARGQTWRLTRSTPFADCEAADLEHPASRSTLTLLLPFDRLRPLDGARPRVVSRMRWAHEVAALAASAHPHGSLRFCPQAIRLLPYQLEPALAVLRHGALRVLVGDDVGLGKTVEAGVVVREVAKGDHLSRILILCPAGLRGQWIEEMRALFDLEVIDAGADWLRTRGRVLPPEINPWALPGIHLASLDFIKRAESLRSLEDVRWDLLVVDEAHGATPGSHRHAAVDAVACRSRRVMLLTATPHSGDEDQFKTLCEVGAEMDSEPIVLFNRARPEVLPGVPAVRSSFIRVRLSEAERQAHRLLESYTSRVWSESRRRGDRAGELLATVLRKRALSSPGSLALSVRRRLELLGPGPPPASQLSLPWHEEEEPDDGEGVGVMGVRGLESGEEEVGVLREIAVAAERAEQSERKIAALLRLLTRARESAIVFSEYRDTAERLRAHLAGLGRQVFLLHGGIAPRERLEVLRAFAAWGGVLVATDAASEGLNLQRSCRLVVHFELPWTPGRLNQRCGRVNRMGQARVVHEIALVADDTAEELVLAPLVRRAMRVRGFVSGGLTGQLGERQVADRVFGDTGDSRAPAVVRRTSVMALRAEAAAEVARLELMRRIAGRPAPGGDRYRRPCIPLVCAARRGPLSHRVLVVLELTLASTDGEVVEREVLPVLFDTVWSDWPRRSRPLRSRMLAALEVLRPAIDGVAARQIGLRLREVETARNRVLGALARREWGFERQMRSAARELVQPGLFDRRALRALGARERVVAGLDEETQVRLAGADRAGRLGGSHQVRAVMIGAPW